MTASRNKSKQSAKGNVTDRAPQQPGTTSGHGSSRRHRHAIAVGLICILVALAYGNSLWNGFALDDKLIIQTNPLIRTLRNIPTLFISHYWEGASISGQERSHALYRPFVLTTYTVNYMVSGLRAWPFHLTNILIHLGVVLTLYGIALRLALGWPAALVTALVFAVHPLNSEAVTNLVGRAELLMALGVLMAFYWDLGKNAVQTSATKVSLLSVGAFALGVFSKEQAIMLVGLLIIADGMRRNDGRGQAWWRIFWDARFRYFAYLMIAAVYLVTRTAVVGMTLPPSSNIRNPLSVIEPTLSLINAVKVAGTYLWLSVWPERLSADYSYNAIAITHTPLDPAVWGSALLWILLFVMGAVAFFKRQRSMAIGTAITFLFFLPAANLIVHIGTIMGERLFYLPLAGLCLVLGTGWHWSAQRLARAGASRYAPFIGVGVTMLVLVPLTLRTIIRNKDWESSYTVVASAIQARPDNARAHAMLGSLHRQRGALDKALEELEAALTIVPRYIELPIFARRYGGLLIDLGRVQEAIAVMEAATRANPEREKDPFIQRALAVAYERNNDLVMAATARKRAITTSQAIPRTSSELFVLDYGELARIYTLQGRTAEARQALNTSLKLVGEDQRLSERTRTKLIAQILGNLALIDSFESKFTTAEKRYLQVLELLRSPLLADQTPVHMARLRDYARLLRKMGREQEAAVIDEKAAAIGSPKRASKVFRGQPE